MPVLILLLALTLGLSVGFSSSANADDDIYLDTSQHSVAVTTDFAGTDLLVFGSTAAPCDVVVVVRGPAEAEKVWRREREGGIWINRASATIENAPSFYWIGSTRRLDDVIEPGELDRRGFGVVHLRPRILTTDTEAGSADYWQALVRSRERLGTYGADDRGVQVINGHLFRTTLHLPAALPMGAYTIEAYRIQDGRVTASAVAPLVVTKAGFSARLARFARQQSTAYAAAAIAAAIAAGWVAATAFRRA
jgi:uncharacterized protein (TIGR02186 family)